MASGVPSRFKKPSPSKMGSKAQTPAVPGAAKAKAFGKMAAMAGAAKVPGMGKKVKTVC